jgi:hypothetical protein
MSPGYIDLDVDGVGPNAALATRHLPRLSDIS